jgi:hypothetical protein
MKLPSELVGGEVNRQEFVNTYMRLLGTGLSILEKDSCLPQEEIRILKTFLTEGYGSLLKKYKKIKHLPVSVWMEKQIGGKDNGRQK